MGTLPLSPFPYLAHHPRSPGHLTQPQPSLAPTSFPSRQSSLLHLNSFHSINSTPLKISTRSFFASLQYIFPTVSGGSRTMPMKNAAFFSLRLNSTSAGHYRYSAARTDCFHGVVRDSPMQRQYGRQIQAMFRQNLSIPIQITLLPL